MPGRKDEGRDMWHMWLVSSFLSRFEGEREEGVAAAVGRHPVYPRNAKWQVGFASVRVRPSSASSNPSLHWCFDMSTVGRTGERQLRARVRAQDRKIDWQTRVKRFITFSLSGTKEWTHKRAQGWGENRTGSGVRADEWKVNNTHPYIDVKGVCLLCVPADYSEPGLR